MNLNFIYLYFLSFTFILLLGACNQKKLKISSTSTPFPSQQLDSVFTNSPTQVTFIIQDLKTSNQYIYNKKRATIQYPIASTFKMLNSLIALEENVIKETDTLYWDGVNRPLIKEWNQNHTLASAYKNSVVWFYQELARKLNRKTYQNYLDKTNLGNKTIGENIDAFWLDSSLKISTIQQINFLTNLISKKLPFSDNTYEIGKRVMTELKNDSIQLIAKTGMYVNQTTHTPIGGWYIGYIEKNKVPEIVFALNIEITENSQRHLRKKLAKTILKKLNYL